MTTLSSRKRDAADSAAQCLPGLGGVITSNACKLTTVKATTAVPPHFRYRIAVEIVVLAVQRLAPGADFAACRRSLVELLALTDTAVAPGLTRVISPRAREARRVLTARASGRVGHENKPKTR